MQLQAILFDLWGTLVLDPPERSLPRMAWRAEEVRRALADHGFVSDLELITLALSSAGRELGALQDKGIDLVAGGRAELFAGLYEKAAGVRPPEAALPDVEEAIGVMPVAFQPIEAPGAVETLAEVKAAGLATGLVSNAGLTTSPHLLRLIRDYDMAPHLDYMVFSDDLGLAKPDARIFRECLAALQVPAGACAYVGDSPHNDVWGAQQLGMLAVQIGKRQRDGIVPDAHIESMSQLLPVLQTLERAAGPVRG